ncbi:hypothetical protein FSP39_001885 [Pinctada imbricata]|uniref:Uncharacterized protein n=1 Tax=Pinctada imbricata TaxID=66713 RepID=A0AA88Y1X9_PINIB|nr:hypothetical protein FSP39_001885 [Pinctada imbricata]
MMLRYLILFSFDLISLVICKHGKIANYCSEPTPPAGVQQKPRPNVTSQFSAHIQCVIMNKKLTTDIHEYFDSVGNRGAVKQLDSGVELDAWYSYNTNEFIAYYVPTGQCLVQTLSQSDQRFLFGYQPQGATGRIFSAAQMLHLQGQGVVDVYMGTDNVRGITVDTWQSCQYWDAYDATMNVKWYFTATGSANEWDTAVGVSVPVAVRVTGRSYNASGLPHDFDHWYEFFHFRPDTVDPRNFETPAGVQCPGRKNTKDLPTMPNTFSFMSEFVDKQRKTVSFMKEFYTFDEKVVMYQYRPLASQNSRYGTNDLLEVHDFNTGVAYITDRMYGNCTATRIELTFDDRQVDKNHVKMRDSREFFYFDQIQYTYEGIKTVRNIECDSWVGVRPNWPSAGVQSTWQWFFARNTWVEVNTGNAQGGTPVMLVIDAPDVSFSPVFGLFFVRPSVRPSLDRRVMLWHRLSVSAFGTPIVLVIDAPDISLHYEYNLYNFAINEPDILNFDISKCYIQGNRRRFQLSFSGDFKSAVYGNLEMFRYFIVKSLTQYLKISALRISNLHVYYSMNDVIVVFTLLDVAPLYGNIQNPIAETPLATAAASLTNLVNSSSLAISLDATYFPNVPAMVANPQNFVETTYLHYNNNQPPAKTGYSPGNYSLYMYVRSPPPLIESAAVNINIM